MSESALKNYSKQNYFFISEHLLKLQLFGDDPGHAYGALCFKPRHSILDVMLIIMISFDNFNKHFIQ